MDDQDIRKEILISTGGTGDQLREVGIIVQALINPAAQLSVISEELFAQLEEKGRTIFETIEMAVLDFSSQAVKAAYLVIGIETKTKRFVTALSKFAVVPNVDHVIVGANTLTQLGVGVKYDFKSRTVTVEDFGWEDFEKEVASAYRTIGAEVRENINLAGFQIDIYAEEKTTSGQLVRLAIECKYYKDRVGNKVVNDFARILATLKEANLVDRGVIVSSAGFSADASLVAKESAIDLLTLENLQQHSSTRSIYDPNQTSTAMAADKEVITPQRPKLRAAKVIFVLMPFSSEFEDVYHLGIRDVAQELGIACERADELDYVGGALEKIYDSIRDADLLVAEVSSPNPNVYYEVGYAHALAKPVILLSSSAKNIPFDLRNYNHIVYSSIVELRQRLERAIKNIPPSQQ